jgi:hypothetical protein
MLLVIHIGKNSKETAGMPALVSTDKALQQKKKPV